MRPLVVTFVSIVFIIFGLLSLVFPAILHSTGFYPTAQLYGFRLSFPVYAAFFELVGIYALVQGYGFWWMKAWSWWLYVAFIVIRLLLAFLIPQTVDPIEVAGIVLELLFLGYMIARRDRFHVKMP